MSGQIHRSASIGGDIAAIAAGLGSDPVLVTDPALVDAGVIEPLSRALACPTVVVAPGEPTVESVTSVACALAEAGGAPVVAVGGGSVLDTAKLASRLISDPGGLAGHLEGAEPFSGGVPLVAVPTTAGSGAESTRTAVVTHRGRKTWAWDEALLPEAVVLAPELTVGLPTAVTVASGLDAFIHAVEAVTGRRKDLCPVEEGLDAIVTIRTRLPTVVVTPGDVAGRAALLEAAAVAGRLIDASGTGVGHAIGHALGSLLPIPHGLAVMLGHRAALEWVIRGNADAYAPVAAALVPSGRVSGLPALFDRLAEEVGFDQIFPPLASLGVAALASELGAPSHLPMLSNTPRPVLPDDVRSLAEYAVERWPR